MINTNFEYTKRSILEYIAIVKSIHNKEIVIFGTGEMSITIVEDLISCLADLPVYYLDNSLSRQGTKINNIPVFSPEKLEEAGFAELKIIVASMYYQDISNQLIQMGFRENIDFYNGGILYNILDKYKAHNLYNELITFSKHASRGGDDMSFLKHTLVSNNYDWLGLSYEKLYLLGLIRWHEIIMIDDNTGNIGEIDIKMDDDYRDVRYNGIKLYDVCIYNACVELRTFINDIDMCIEKHRKVLKKWYEKGARFIAKAELYFSRYNIDSIVTVQGYSYNSAILRLMAIRENLKVLTLENTYNKDRAIWDDISGISVNKNLSKNYYWRYKDIVELSDVNEYVCRYIKNINSYKQPEHITPLSEGPGITLKGKVIVFIGQVYTDSSVIFGLWKFKNPIELVEILVDYVIQHDYSLIIKLHPKEYLDKGVFSNLTYDKIVENTRLFDKIRSSENIIVDNTNKYNTYVLIEKADVCVTINSQAGLEAMLMDKELILCGQAFYGGLGICYEAYNADLLKFCLNLVLEKGRELGNITEVSKFFFIQSEYYMIGKSEEALISKLSDMYN